MLNRIICDAEFRFVVPQNHDFRIHNYLKLIKKSLDIHVFTNLGNHGFVLVFVLDLEMTSYFLYSYV